MLIDSTMSGDGNASEQFHQMIREVIVITPFFILYLYYNIDFIICQGVFYIFFRAPLRSCITLVSVEAICRSPLDALIVSQLGRFVKSYIFPRRYLTRTSFKRDGEKPVAYFSHFTRVRPLKRRVISFVPLLYHNLGDLSRGFCHFLDYVVGQATTHQGGLTSSP